MREKSLTKMVSFDMKMPSCLEYSWRSFETAEYRSTASEILPLSSWCSTCTPRSSRPCSLATDWVSTGLNWRTFSQILNFLASRS